MNDFAAIISSIGFPIAACIALGWYIYYLTKQHRAEVQELVKCIDNNTKICEKILSKLERMDEK